MFWICQGYLPDGFRWDRKQDVHQPMIFLRNHRRDVFTQKEPKIDRDYRLISIGMVVWTAPTKSHRCSSCSPLVFVVKYGIHHFLTKPFTRYHGFNSRIEKREIQIINPYDQAWNINSTISQFLQKYPPMGKHKVSPQQTSRLYSHFFHPDCTAVFHDGIQSPVLKSYRIFHSLGNIWDTPSSDIFFMTCTIYINF